jgi:hypothetical protein
MDISPHGGSDGQTELDSSTGDFQVWLKRALGVECLSLCEHCEGNLEGGCLAGDPEGYVEKVLETSIYFHRGPVLGNLEEGLSTGDFKRWMKGALWMKCLSL